MSEVAITLSSERLHPYMQAAGFDVKRALELYSWNLELSAAFLPLLSCVEVGLRNRIIPCLTDKFGEEWWRSDDYRRSLGPKGSKLILRAESELRRRGRDVTEGRVTAELSFGFWANMFLPKHEAELWPILKPRFNNMAEEVTCAVVLEKCKHVRELRNRISHHETLLRRDITADYSAAVELLGWICPDTQQWIKPRLSVMRLLRKRP